MKKFFVVLFFFCVVPNWVVTGISWAGEPVQVTVSILPQKYFVKKIGKDAVRISVMVAPGSNPATYEPRPSQMRTLVRSKIYFTIGVPFEKVWLEKFRAVTPMMKVVHTDQSVSKREISACDHRNEEKHKKIEGASHKAFHRASFLDPHIWLSPLLVKIQSRVIAKSLMEVDPARKGFYEHNLGRFEAELDRLDVEIREIFEDRGRGFAFFVFHPSWGYFADAYGLKQIPFEIEGKEPRATEMARLARYARDKGIKVIFVQPQFSTKSAEAIARETGARVVIADPLREDWMKNLREVAEKFKAALQ